MVNLNPTDVDDKISPKQEAFIIRLLNSSVFSKREYERIWRIFFTKKRTAQDASLLINYLTSAIEFRKAFYSKNYRAHKKCYFCKSKKVIARYYDTLMKKQVFVCYTCDGEYHNVNSKLMKTQKFCNWIDEEQEAKCDLARKNPADSNVKIGEPDMRDIVGVNHPAELGQI